MSKATAQKLHFVGAQGARILGTAASEGPVRRYGVLAFLLCPTSHVAKQAGQLGVRLCERPCSGLHHGTSPPSRCGLCPAKGGGAPSGVVPLGLHVSSIAIVGAVPQSALVLRGHRTRNALASLAVLAEVGQQDLQPTRDRARRRAVLGLHTQRQRDAIVVEPQRRYHIHLQVEVGAAFPSSQERPQRNGCGSNMDQGRRVEHVHVERLVG
eukprot:scaffold1661_cov251-Pinguiococcus_pyrenoidosus.AAC.7